MKPLEEVIRERGGPVWSGQKVGKFVEPMGPPVTLMNKAGVAFVYASEEEALAQAAHDRSLPGDFHPNPKWIATGDLSATHYEPMTNRRAEVVAPDTLRLPDNSEIELLHNSDALNAMSCPCSTCEYQRLAPHMSIEDRGMLRQVLGTRDMMDLLDLDGSDALHAWRVQACPPCKGGSVPGAGFTVTSTAVALAAATAKHVVGFVTATNTPVDIVEFEASGDATSGNLLIELTYGTSAGNGTSTAFTPLQMRGPTQATNSTAGITYTAEPTVVTVIKRVRMTWPGGPFILQSPLGREINSVIAGTTSGHFVGIRATSTVAVTNSDWTVEVEE